MFRYLLVIMLIGCVTNAPRCLAQGSEPDAKLVVPAALLKFQQRGSKTADIATQVTDLLFANLAAEPDLWLVERDELSRVLGEQELNLSGAVNPGQAVQVGQLTGAKVLITGSVIRVENTTYIVAKLIGTETSRVLGVSVKGGASDGIDVLAEQLAKKIGATIVGRSKSLVAKPVRTQDRIASMQQRLGKTNRPKLWIEIKERHVGRPSVDPAAETELMVMAKESGFEVIDSKSGLKAHADIVVTGEGFSEFSSRLGNLVSVKSRLEVKAVDRDGKILAIDRQTTRKVDLAEAIAGKAALQEAAAQIAERLLVNMVKSPGKFVKGNKKKKKRDRKAGASK